MKSFNLCLLASICFIIFALYCAGCSRNKTLPPTVVTAADNATEQKAYLLQPGDNIDIKLFYNPELNENVTIRPDGKITMQLIDDIKAAGLTPAQLDSILTDEYQKHLRQPNITVVLKSFEGQRIYVGGEVNIPREISLVGRTNALQAIVQAGGFRDDAALTKVVILSKGANNKPEARIINLKKALKGEVSEKAYMLQPFDIVFVPKTKLAKADQFIKHIYSFIPPRVTLGFHYELHDDAKRTRNNPETYNFSFQPTP